VTLQPRLQQLRKPLALGLPDGVILQRLEQFRTKRKWWQFWAPKYHIRMYALTSNGVYDVTDALKESK
jgi:hypothetical protein